MGRELETRNAEVQGSIKAVTEIGAKSIEKAAETALARVTATLEKVKAEIESLDAFAFRVGQKVGKMERIFPSKREVEGYLEFVSTPHQLPKNHPALATAANSLLSWAKCHEHELSYTNRDRIMWGLGALAEEMARKQ